MTPNELANLLYDYAGAVQDFLNAMAYYDENEIGEALITLDTQHEIVLEALLEIFQEEETEH